MTGKRVMKKITLLVLLGGLFNLAWAEADAELPGGIEKCLSCHGELGVSHYDLWPNLAGQKRAYLANQLRLFRAGSRYDPWMSPIATPLSDKEIEELSRFFSQLPLRP